ncbi:hypothetical protein DFH11DRAFT_1255141 [Phellopilus nigrolimitatus]|nr:hypothetical protein DFH11DRAFT_1255141 [Phellopilus nigrolimitatus]
MSFQYPYIEHYSPAPATPLDAFNTLQWDIQDDAGQLTAVASASAAIYTQSPAMQQHCQIHQQQSSNTPTPTEMQMQSPVATLTPPETQPAQTQTYESPQVIQLIERPLRRPRQQPAQPQSKARNHIQAYPQAQQKQAQTPSRPASNLSTPTHNPTEMSGTQQQQQDTPQSVSSVPPPGKWLDLHELSSVKGDKAQRPATATARAQARLAAHPYHRRAVSGPGAVDVSATSKIQTQVAKGAILAGNTVQSPTQQTSPSSLSAASPATSTSEPRRYLIRTDVHFNAATNTLTAMLELPGVKRAHLRLALGVCPRSRVTQLIVRGCSRPLLPEGGPTGEGGAVSGYMVHERKLGEFKRVLVVPPETKPNSVKVTMEDGILFIRYPAGAQASKDESECTPTD